MITNGNLIVQLPRFDYIVQHNDYSGSCGRFRYKVFPVEKDETETVITAAVYQDSCFEIEDGAGRTKKSEFAYSNEGIDAAEAWIAQQYDSFQAE